MSDADERFVNFLELVAERRLRMPALFRIKRAVDALWADEHKLLPTVTSAIELDESLDRGDRRAHPGADRPQVELSSNVDPGRSGV